MLRIDQIRNAFHDAQRNKIALCREYVADIDYIDVGRQMAQCFASVANPDALPGIETLHERIFSRVASHPQLGKYLAIDNIGFLFEPALHLNLPLIFDASSRNNWLIVHTDAQIVDDRLYFLTSSNPYILNLSNLNYRIF